MRNELPEVLPVSQQQGPISRRLLITMLTVPFAFIAFRVVSVQAAMQQRYADPWRKTSISKQDVPARNGRIVTSDGLVLARDETKFELQVHYRWLELPPNKNWLRREARSRLTWNERKDPDRVAVAESVVLAEREQAWAELTQLVTELPVRRRAVQDRVERIRDVVMRKRAEKRDRRNDEPMQSSNIFATIWRELTTAPKRSANDPLVLREEIDYHPLGEVPDEVIARVLDRPTRFRGMRVATNSKRAYPYGDLASHVIGFRSKPPENEQDAATRIATGQNTDTTVGRAGVERSYDRLLRGREGSEQIERRRDGLEIGRTPSREPIHGTDVTLTIDSRLQRAAEAALDAALDKSETAVGGAVVLMDVQTGALLALASGPRISPTIYQGATRDEWNRVVDDPHRPLFPRATQMAIPPGSVFKLVTAIAGLESGWNPSQTVFCQGYFRTPDQERCALFRAAGYGHDKIAIDSALGMSCNVFFFELSAAIQANPLRDWAGRCGFGWQTGIDLPGETSGQIPTRDGFPYAGSVRQFAIGQGQTTATPLQVARLTAAIANGGRLVRPRVVASNEYASDKLNLQPTTLNAVRLGMIHSVHGPLGTARNLATLPVRVAGKTGSAEVGGERQSHAWFTGYFPAEAPRYAVTVAIEHGGSGGKVAGPIAEKLIKATVRAN